jgi:hypothetical protein
VSDTQSQPRPFFDLFGDGKAAATDIDDFIDAWHESGNAEQRSLAEFLGLTDDEYSLWLMDRRTLPAIAGARRSGQTLEAAVAERLEQLQAANDPIDRTAVFALGNWLKARGVGQG